MGSAFYGRYLDVEDLRNALEDMWEFYSILLIIKWLRMMEEKQVNLDGPLR